MVGKEDRWYNTISRQRLQRSYKQIRTGGTSLVSVLFHIWFDSVCVSISLGLFGLRSDKNSSLFNSFNKTTITKFLHRIEKKRKPILVLCLKFLLGVFLPIICKILFWCNSNQSSSMKKGYLLLSICRILTVSLDLLRFGINGRSKCIFSKLLLWCRITWFL